MKLLQNLGLWKPAQDKAEPKWTCGRFTSGKACSLGPDRLGKCQTLFACVPSQSSGKWNCGLPTSEGGPCKRGPGPDGTCCRAIPPCAPVRSIRTQREAVAKWVAALVFGLLALAITYAGSAMLLRPGPMTSAHSSIGQCKSCHSNVMQGRFGWVHSIFAPANPRKDSSACLTCHKMTPAALNPHGLEGEKLEAITDRLKSHLTSTSKPAAARVQNTIFPFEKAMSKGVFCATCHKEHKGEAFNMKQVPNARCHTCHAVQFTSFDKDHPKFNKYPFRRRTRIFFDHVSHFSKHFPETAKENNPSKSVPGACANCHQPTADKKHMAVKPFDQVCAACHTGQIVGTDRATGPKGVALFTLPGLDVATLKEKKTSIGQWPEASEAEITPFMKLLIGRDDARKQLLKKVSELDLLDLSKASKGDIANVKNLVWEVKTLIYELSTAKTSDVMKRIGAATGKNIKPGLIAKLTASLPRDVLMGARQQWLPKLEAEITRHKRGTNIPTIASPSPQSKEPKVDAESWAELGGWYRQDFSILYRPKGHKDPLFKAWLNFTGRLYDDDPGNLAKPVFDHLTDKEAQGQCAKCHSIDVVEGKGRKVQWKPSTIAAKTPRFTSFIHEPHFGVIGKQGCLTCHALDKKAEYQKTYKGFNPKSFASNFKPVEKQQCATCHKSKAARQDCLLCHNYHVNGVASPIMSTKLPK